MAAFLGQVKKGVPSSTFKAFIKRALEWEATGREEGTAPNQLQFQVGEESFTVYVLNCDVKDINNVTLTRDTPHFGGAPLVFLDLPKASLFFYV